jgi:hypothetical protein
LSPVEKLREAAAAAADLGLASPAGPLRRWPTKASVGSASPERCT